MGSNTDFRNQNDTQNMDTHQVSSENQKNYRNMREYAQDLQGWLWQYRMWTSFCSFQSQFLATMPPASFTPSQSTYPQVNNNSVPRSSTSTTAPHSGQQETSNNFGTQYRVPMLWKRMAAECLDFILLFYTKILVTVAVLRQMGYVNDNLLDIEAQLPLFADFGELDYEKMFSLTSELIALEVVNRLCITLVETMCIRKGYAGSIGGATPGKKIMKLRVVSFTEVREMRNGDVLVVGERDPGFINALVRSTIKNFSMAFFFPACFTVFFFRFNRAAYDILATTVVVEVDNTPPRQQQN